MLNKPATTSAPINDLMTRRWSTRAFDAARSLTSTELTSLLEAARWAPSANNSQPWRFLVWNKVADAAAWRRAFECLSPGNQAWAGNAPLLMLSCVAAAAPDGKPYRHGAHDTGMALFSLMLQAVELGLATHAMAGFNADKARAEFAVPAEFTPMTMIAIGHQAAPDILGDEVKMKELVPRTRRALAETFYAGTWGTPAAHS